jgi:serine-type D-Ala-D-Ala carboxypeptidase (penicillin-binding protein 5/6)
VTRTPRVPAALAACLALLLTLVGSGPAAAELAAPAPPALGEELPPGWPTLEGLEASSWVLVEAATGQVLAAHRADVTRPVASTIKVLTALTVLDRSEPDDVVEAGEEARGVEGASVGLVPGDRWTIEQLLDAIIVRSGNDAANVLAVHVAGDVEAFTALMAEDAERLGLADAVVVDPSGLTDENLLDALDLATLARAALADPRLRPLLARETVELPGLGPVVTRNELLLDYPGATGVKTGFTLAAGNSLVGSAERGGRELIAVVLDAGEDPATRFAEVARLLDLGFDAFVPRTVTAEVALAVAGGSRRYELAPTPVTTPQDLDPQVEVTLPVRPTDGPLDLQVLAGSAELGPLPAPPVDTAPAAAADGDLAGGARLGRAVVDGAYAALRAASADGTLG